MTKLQTSCRRLQITASPRRFINVYFKYIFQTNGFICVMNNNSLTLSHGTLFLKTKPWELNNCTFKLAEPISQDATRCFPDKVLSVCRQISHCVCETRSDDAERGNRKQVARFLPLSHYTEAGLIQSTGAGRAHF